MVKREVFVCDFCGKASHHLKEGSDVPYNQGWRFLENFSFKASESYKHESIRKQFCSRECMLRFVDIFTNEEESKISPNIMLPNITNDRFKMS